MTAKEKHFYAKWCNDNGITIFPVPMVNSGGIYKIAVSKNGEVKQGDQLYKDTPEKGIPAWSDKVWELYKIFYDKNNKPTPVNQ